MFIHFEPTGRKLEDIDKVDMMYDGPNNPGNYEQGVLLPPYLIPGSPEAIRFADVFPFGWDKPGGQGYSSDEEEYESGDEDHSDDGYEDAEEEAEDHSGDENSKGIFDSEDEMESDEEESEYGSSDEDEDDSEDSEELEDEFADEAAFSRQSQPTCRGILLDSATPPSICRDN